MAADSAERARFESLAFRVLSPPGRSAREAARSALRAAGPGRTWSLERLGPYGEFEAIPDGGRTSFAQAWTLAYALRDQPGVTYAEPLFEIESAAQFPRAVRATRSSGSKGNAPGTDDCEWSPKLLRVPEAWALFGARTPGAGIVIGHPDTGYTEHPELPSDRLQLDRAFDFVDEDDDARDPLARATLEHPGHGTSTGSLIVSPHGPQPGADSRAFVSGVAPGARLMPLRVTRSVVLWSTRKLTRAIRHAVDRGAHVVSISLGGPAPSVALHNAVRDAERAGVIVLCAAGNEVRFVVYPGAFAEVIAVAASRVDDSEWPGSCRGPAVDITAPGASVWRARTVMQGKSRIFSVERGNGTSYAVAQVAGIAALWLSLHGRANLVAQHGRAGLGAAFRALLQHTCRTPDGWNTDDFGPGIADALAALSLPLDTRRVRLKPDTTREVRLKPDTMREVRLEPDTTREVRLEPDTTREVRLKPDTTSRPLDWLTNQLTPAPRSGVIRVLSDLLHVPEQRLDAALGDVGAELAVRVGVDSVLRGQLRAAAVSAARPSVTRSPAVSAARRRAADRMASPRLKRYLS